MSDAEQEKKILAATMEEIYRRAKQDANKEKPMPKPSKEYSEGN
jgi:hypothetical protein